MEQNARTHIAGHRGMIGTPVERRLRSAGYSSIETRPEYILITTAKFSGIHANSTYCAAQELGWEIGFSAQGDEEIGAVYRASKPERAKCKVGDASKAEARLDWEPETNLRKLARAMVQSGCQAARRGSLAKAASFRTCDYNE